MDESLFFDPILLCGAIVLFVVVAVGMLLAPLLLGLLLRPTSPPGVEKAAVYECGEPTIGTSQVQFDLRFYVVALLFIIFDVEVAFFFPWAVVFGKANTLSDPRLAVVERQEISRLLHDVPLSQFDAASERSAHLIVGAETARQLQRVALADLAVFFFVVLVGFAYVWKRGDLDWVRSVSVQRAAEAGLARPPLIQKQPVLSS